MKRLSLTLLLMFALSAWAQKYEIAFYVPQCTDTILYLGQHYRDEFRPIDSARVQGQSGDAMVIFKGKKQFEPGIYCLYSKGKKTTQLLDFTIDGSQKFSIRLSPAHDVLEVKGSPANQAMFDYLARVKNASSQAKDINNRKKSSDPSTRTKAEHEMETLTDIMTRYEDSIFSVNSKYRFFHLAKTFGGPHVPDGVADKPYYFRAHFWDGVDLSDHSLVNTPDLFNKMNYYFFGVLYNADADTICKYADRVLTSIQHDTLMLRYFLDFITPRYFRSTKNIGWDAVWCHLVRQYYLADKCPWALPSDISNKQAKVEQLEKSLIGAIGAELWMADTNQSPDQRDWISSHRFPQKYVILWFWDPDCHHCQEQTATLKTLYDSLSAAGNKIFEVYAVGFESDVPKWIKYVRDHQLPFVNVGGTNVNIDYQEAYNVHGAPTMIILNEERRIIMNKVIPTKSILPFLERYEKQR
ncbi:MAG: DUF5106 domain-containing protein [Bacteroidales bacterium]|nr:DUF5106 domain-containing protein [Bacteroidales bacterium]